MITIHKKIIILCVIIWLIMAAIWLVLSFYNQKTVEKYNEILQRYLLMHQTMQRSHESTTVLNSFLADGSDTHLTEYDQIVELMLDSKRQLHSLKNTNNDLALMNFEHMIESQLSEMELAVFSFQGNRLEHAAMHFNEVNNISQFISEATLNLLSKELNTYDDFYRQMIQQSNDLQKMGFWMLAMASFILLLFSYRFAAGISQPIHVLTQAAKEISRGNFDRHIEIPSNDEMSFLARTLNRMRVNLKNLIEEMQNKAQVELDLQEHKLLLKESELKSLQSQINPHFLFNTLNTLSKKAYLEGAAETSELISSVSELLRYNLRRLDVSVTLQDELKGLEEYLAIQKTRFMDRVKYSLDIDQRCLSFEMPSLTLQPFVENAFIHAIEPSEEGGEIEIVVTDEAEKIQILIQDNGVGMSEERVQHILSGEAEELNRDRQGHSTGIGIHNVIRRLQLFYGIQEVIHIEARPQQGTRVTLQLPKERGDQFVQNSHRR